jgi:hypothetical protein
MKKIFIWLILSIGLIFSQTPPEKKKPKTTAFYHSNVYFASEQVVLDMLGPPSSIDSSFIELKDGGKSPTVIYVYPMANMHEMVWLIFGDFGI